MTETNPNARLEAFCDGVFAIAITLLILELKVPPIESIHSEEDVWQGLIKLWPSFFALGLSFIIILIAWIGHHNLMKTLEKTSGQFQIANGFFLFTVIFIPFPTAMVAEYLNTSYAQPAIVFYCLNGLLHNIGWNVLYLGIFKPVPLVKSHIGVEEMKKNSKGAKYGLVVYAAIALLSWWFPYTALIISLILWMFWLYFSAKIIYEKPN